MLRYSIKNEYLTTGEWWETSCTSAMLMYKLMYHLRRIQRSPVMICSKTCSSHKHIFLHVPAS